VSTKLHLRTDRYGRPLAILATPGQRHEVTQLAALLDAGAVKRSAPDGGPGRGQPRKRPATLVGDKGYSFPSARRLLRRRGIRSVIPTKSNQHRQPSFDRVAYRGRNRVERSVGRLKQCRRVATRYDKRAVNYLAWVTLAAAVIWLRPFADTP
jgi:transposase